MTFRKVVRNRPGHSGEFHWNARLTDWDIRAILRRCEQGEAYAAIAGDYGVSRGYIRRLHRKEKRA